MRPHFVKWVRTNSEHQDKMVRKTKPSRLFFIRNTLSQNKRTTRLGQSFSQQRHLSIRKIYNFQPALLSHMHGLRGTA